MGGRPILADKTDERIGLPVSSDSIRDPALGV